MIDVNQKRLYTQADTTHPFKVKFDEVIGFAYYSMKHDTSELRVSLPLVPFDWKFNQITAISQDVHGVGMGSYAYGKNPFVLKLGPSGVAPSYVLMPLIHCFYGEVTQRAATYNLGRYIAHIVDNKKLKPVLVDPSRNSGGGMAMGLLMAGVYGVSAASGGQALAAQNLQLMTQAAELQQAQSATVDASRGTAWYSKMVDEVFGFTEADRFVDLEKLVDLL